MHALLDTHQHLIYRDRLGYAWSDGVPALQARDFTVADYHELTAGRDVAASIFMETGVDDADYRSEARFVADLARDPSNRIAGVIASCRPEREAGFDAWLDECAELPVCGFRRILHEIDDALSTGDGFRGNIRKIGARGLTFDMCFRADQLPIARALAETCENTQLVLDHCGVPDIAGGALDPWRGHVSDLAALPNVVAKLSGVLTYCAPDDAGIDAIRPYVEHVIDCFGPDRLIWGSDWPVVNINADLPDWIAIFRTLIAPLSTGEQRAICHLNAERVYGVTR